jgi:uncharacterized protein
MAKNYFVLLYDVVPDYLTRRQAHREEHLRLATESHARGELVLGGAFAEPADQAMLVFRAEDSAIVERFVKADPYVTNGIVTRWRIRPWTVVIGA